MGHENHNGAIIYPTGVVLPESVTAGIKVGDEDASNWTYRDLEGIIRPDPGGGDAPTLAAWTTNTRDYRYNVGDVMDMLYHIPHDLVPGADAFIHVHWGHVNAVAPTAGKLDISFYATYAKGHNQQAFPSDFTNTAFSIDTSVISVPQRMHRIDEILFATAGGGSGLLDANTLEVDGLLKMKLAVTDLPIVGGVDEEVFIFTVDLHYLSRNVGTKNKSFPFYA